MFLSFASFLCLWAKDFSRVRGRSTQAEFTVLAPVCSFSCNSVPMGSVTDSEALSMAGCHLPWRIEGLGKIPSQICFWWRVSLPWIFSHFSSSPLWRDVPFSLDLTFLNSFFLSLLILIKFLVAMPSCLYIRWDSSSVENTVTAETDISGFFYTV